LWDHQDDIEKYKLPGNLRERLAREFKEMINMRITADYYMVY
jgi:hypothetical protein